MSQPQHLDALDARGTAAGADLRDRAAARPVPAFDPARTPSLAVAVPPSAPRRGRSLAAVAAAIALVAGGAVWWNARPESGGETADQVITGDPRPFVATDLPAGLELMGAFGTRAATPGGGPADADAAMVLYGTDVREPGLGVTALPVSLGDEDDGTGFSFGEDAVPLDIRGFDAYGTSEPGSLPSSVGFLDGDRVVLLVSGSLTVDDLADLVPAVETDAADGGVAVRADALPDGWGRLGVMDDGLFALSSLAVVGTAEGGPTSFTAAYASPSPDGSDSASSSYLTVRSSAGSEAGAFAAALVVEAPERVTVRGHQAVIGAVPSDGSFDGLPVWTVSWTEAPGEVVRMVGVGLSRDEMLAVAEGLEPVGAAEWKALVEQTRLGGVGTVAGPAVGEGRFADGTRWVLRLDAPPGTDGSPGSQLFVDLDRSSGSSSMTSFTTVGAAIGEDAEPHVGILDVSVDEYGDRQFLSGLVTAEVASLEVRAADGTVLERLTVVEGAGRRGYAAELTDESATLVALDADGSEVDAQGIDRPGEEGGESVCSQVLEEGSTTEECHSAPEPTLPGAGD